MSKKVFVICSALLFASTLSTAQAVTLKIATLAPSGTTWMKEMKQGAKTIARQTSNRVKLKFYPGGVMGNDKNVLRKMRVGQLHGGAFASGSLINIYPDAQIYSLPFVFRSYDEIDYVRKHMDDSIRAGLEKKGLVAIGISEGGFAYLLSNSPVSKVSDLKGLKVWVPQGDMVSQAMFEASGISPIQLAIADVYTGLQTGLIDTAAGTATGAIAFQWHTKMKYLTDEPLVFLMGILAIDRKAFKKLTPSDQAIVQKVMSETFDRLDQLNREDNNKAKQALSSQGITFTQPTAEEKNNWYSISKTALVELGKQGAYSPAMFETLKKHLKDYRDNVRANSAQKN